MKIKPIIVVRIIGIFAMLIGGALTVGNKVASPALFIAGIGIILRQNWGRWIGMIVFFTISLFSLTGVIVSIFMKMVSDWTIIAFMIIFGLISAFCFWLLTRREIVAEFKRK